MEWSEFTQYIIDTVMKNSTNNDYLQMLKEKNKIEQTKNKGKKNSQTDINNGIR